MTKIVDFQKNKDSRDIAEKKAEELIEYVRMNCTQSPEMLAFLDQPELKRDIIDNFWQFETLRKQIQKDKK